MRSRVVWSTLRKHSLAFLLFVSFVLCLQTVSGFTTYAGTPGDGIETFKRSDFITVIEHWENVWRRCPQFEKVEEYLVKAHQYHGMNLCSRSRYREALDAWGKILEVDRDNEKALRYIRRTREELEMFEDLSN